MKWQYRRMMVSGDEKFDIPAEAKCIQIRAFRKGELSFVEWLEPAEEGEQ